MDKNYIMERKNKRKWDEIDDILRHVRDNRSIICPPREDDEETTRFESSADPYSTNKRLLQRSLYKSRVSELSQAGNLGSIRSITSAISGTSDDKPSSTGASDQYTTVRHAQEYKMECKISYKASNYTYSQKDRPERRQSNLRLGTDISIADIDKTFSGLKETLTTPSNATSTGICSLDSTSTSNPTSQPTMSGEISEAITSSPLVDPSLSFPTSRNESSTFSREKPVLTTSSLDDSVSEDKGNSFNEKRQVEESIREEVQVPEPALCSEYLDVLLSRLKNADVDQLRSSFSCLSETEKDIHGKISAMDLKDGSSFLKSLKADCWSKITTGVEFLRQHIGEYALIVETYNKWVNALEIQRQIEEKQQEIDRLKAHQKNLAYPGNLDIVPVYRSSVSSTTEIVPDKLHIDVRGDSEVGQRDKYTLTSTEVVKKPTRRSHDVDLTSHNAMCHKKREYKKYSFDDCLLKCIEIVRNRTPLSIVVASEENRNVLAHFLSGLRSKCIKRFLKKNPESAGTVLLVLELVNHDIGQVKSLLEPITMDDLPELAQNVYKIMGEVAVQVYNSTRVEEYAQRKKEWKRFLKGALLKSDGRSVLPVDAIEKEMKKPEISIVSFPIEKNSFQDALNTDPLMMGPEIYDRRKRHNLNNKSMVPSWAVPTTST